MLPLLLGVSLAATLLPFHLGPLSIVPLALLLGQFRGRGAFKRGMMAGLGFWIVHLIWLPQSFVRMFGPWGWLPFVPLILFEVLLWAFLAHLTRNTSRLVLVGLWVVLEYLHTFGVMAFPWGDLGYALTFAPGRILAAAGGVWLLSLVVLMVAYGLYRRRWWVIALWALLWLLPLPANYPNRYALLVQGNINPLSKVQGEDAGQRYLGLTGVGLEVFPKADLVIWPETAISHLTAATDSIVGNRRFVTGISYWSPENRYFNRAELVEDGRVVAYHDKTKLVPFGEFFPWRNVLGGVYRFFFHTFGLPNLADTTPGQENRTLGTYASAICYETVFPSVFLGQVRKGAELLITVSNDAWFGDSMGMAQHFDMGILRAVETGRWLLRVGNSGVTASVDPYGRVVSRLDSSMAGYLYAPYALRREVTPYVRFGNWAVGLAGLIAVVGLFVKERPE